MGRDNPLVAVIARSPDMPLAPGPISPLLTATILLAAASLPAAEAAKRWPVAEELQAAQARRDHAAAYELAAQGARTCQASQPHADDCFDLLRLASLHALPLGNLEAAEAFGRAAIASAERGLPEAQNDYAAALRGLALILSAQGRYADAEPFLRRSLNAHLAVDDAVAFGGTMAHRHAATTADINFAIAENIDNQGRFADAEPFFRKALTIREELFAAGSMVVAIAASALSTNLRKQARYPEAEELARRVIDIVEAASDGASINLATVYDRLAIILDFQGRYQDAEMFFRRALGARELLLPEDAADRIGSYMNLALNLDLQGRHREAEPLHRRAVAGAEALLAKQGAIPAVANARLYRALSNLGGNLYRQKRHVDAEPLFRRSLALGNKIMDQSHPDLAIAAYNLALVLRELGQRAETEQLLRYSLSVLEQMPSDDHPYRIQSSEALADFLLEAGPSPEARSLYAKAAALVRKRIRSYPDFGPLARVELSRYRTIFIGEIDAAWLLTRQD